MADQQAPGQKTAQAAPQLTKQQIETALGRLRTQQNLAGGIGAGVVASLVGAAIWAAVTVATGYQIGWMAIGVGFLVGMAVRTVGKGIDNIFGIAGAVLALLGCAVGNLLAVVGFVSQQESAPFMSILSQLDFATIEELMVQTFSPMDLLFYGIAIYEGYKLSFRQVTEQAVKAALAGR